MKTQEFKIEKNIPYKKKEHGSIYPFKDMEIGDSFLVTKCDRKKYMAVSSALNFYIKQSNPTWKFSIRKVDTLSIRVWRIK